MTDPITRAREIMIRQYFVNWSLYLRGFRWLWTREVPPDTKLVLTGDFGMPTLVPWDYVLDYPREKGIREVIRYKPGWTPLKFCLLVYWWDYGLATLLGRGCQSLSRAFELFGQRHHWGQTGPILWGSKDLWKL